MNLTLGTILMSLLLSQRRISKVNALIETYFAPSRELTEDEMFNVSYGKCFTKDYFFQPYTLDNPTYEIKDALRLFFKNKEKPTIDQYIAIVERGLGG